MSKRKISDKKSLSIEHPVGYLPNVLPFWEHLDDGQFEDFCTQWLNLHPEWSYVRGGKGLRCKVIAACRLASGSIQRGVDVRVELENGETWFLQCKLEKEFFPSDVRAAIELAERERPEADGFVLVTACGLSDAAQQIIRDHPKWTWWDSSRLTTEIQKIEPIENGMELVHRFFGIGWVRTIFPWGIQLLQHWSDYFCQDLSDERILFHHRVPFLAMSDTLDRLIEFARTGIGSAIVLSAAGGQGKSRLLLELARTLEADPNLPRVRFLNVGGSQNFNDECSELIARSGDLLLIVEDAHRLDGLVGQIARAAARSKSLRLLVTTRPQAREAVLSEISANGYTERLSATINLPLWKQKEIQDLSDRILSAQFKTYAPRLAQLADRCPLLVVIGAGLLNSGRNPELMMDDALFRQRVYTGFLQEFLHQFQGSDRTRIHLLIRALAFISPVKIADTLFDRLSLILQCPKLVIADDLEQLRNSGLLAENSEGIRLYPDLFADAVLLDAALDRKGMPSELCKAIVSNLSAVEFPALLRNLAETDWETRSKQSLGVSLFNQVWDEYLCRFSSATGNERSAMLRQWAAFAVFQPDRTLSLARQSLALSADSLTSCIPPMLKPIVMWQSTHAREALDILWSLPAEEPKGSYKPDYNPIATISTAAAFDVFRHSGPENVLTWLEGRYQGANVEERLKRQPWIIPHILSPYFERFIEQSWTSGRTCTIRTVPLSPEKTRPLRNRALALARHFALSKEPSVANAAIEVLRIATQETFSRFRETDENQIDHWREDRLNSLAAVGDAIAAQKESFISLLFIREFLQRLVFNKKDLVISEAAEKLLEHIPDTLMLRTARALTCSADTEFRGDPGANFQTQLREAQIHWNQFCDLVAREIAVSLPSAKRVCEYLSSLVETLLKNSFRIQRYSICNRVAAFSNEWSADLLAELTSSENEQLDVFLSEVLSEAVRRSPAVYERILTQISINGRPSQISYVVYFLGWKHLHGGGLENFELESLLACAGRNESEVLTALGTVVGLHFANDPTLAAELLVRLKPTDRASGFAVLEALARTLKQKPKELRSDVVTECLRNIGKLALSTDLRDARYWDEVAAIFPVEVYIHFRDQIGGIEEGYFAIVELPRLGPFPNQAWVDNELFSQWHLCAAKESPQFSRLPLVRALLYSEPKVAEQRMNKIVSLCSDGRQLETAARLFAMPGSRFVFSLPNVVRNLLVDSKRFGTEKEITSVLLLSACGGGRGFTGNEMDKEYLYIKAEAERLLLENRSDPLIAPLYEKIILREKYELEIHRKLIAQADDEMDM